MTLAELNRHLERVRELQDLQQLYSRMLSRAAPGAQRLDGMPHGAGPGNPTAALGEQLAELRTVMEDKKAELKISEAIVMAFINQIRSERIRWLFKLRFVQGLAWCEVADLFGPYIGEDAVKKACYRQLESMGVSDCPAVSRDVPCSPVDPLL